ncbi:hypothetical protein ACWELV_07165 [Streptomyces mirabilis]
MDAYCGEHEEHHAETGRDPIVIADSEIHDAYAENGPDRDEQGLADPERQETEEETEHPAISPGQDHIRHDGSHSSGHAQGLPKQETPSRRSEIGCRDDSGCKS